MKPEHTPFPSGWLSFELQGYRECDSTYCFFPYESLPPLNMSLFRGEFQWLKGQEDDLQVTSDYRLTPEEREQLAVSLKSLINSAQQMGLKLPDSFVRFMESPALQDQIPSCTACYFDLSDEIIELPVEDGGYLIRFLNDQQSVLLWYLYLDSQSNHCIVASPIGFDDESLDDVPLEAIARQIAFSSPSFEEFIYRFWLENQIWYSLDDGRPLTAEQQNYVNYYAKK